MELNTELQRWLSSRNPLLGLDFDGTLAELNSDPDAVRLDAEQVSVLEKLGHRYECAIISGRSLEDLSARLPIVNFHFVGNHGCQIRKKDGSSWQWQSLAWERWHGDSLVELHDLASQRGGWIEDKRFTVTVHFSESPEARQWWGGEGKKKLEDFVSGVATVLEGKRAWNVLPVGAPNKGDSLRKLIQETKCTSGIYFGDEATDETVFLSTDLELLSVKIGEGESAARHRLPSSREVWKLLIALAEAKPSLSAV